MIRITLPKIYFEHWKWNEEFELWVSDLGNFKDKKHKKIATVNNGSGYLVVPTACGFKLAHRVVLFTFKPVMHAMILTIDHLNRNKKDNRVANLEWVTKEENEARAAVNATPVTSKATRPAPAGLICAGKEKFNNIDDAVKWLLQSQGCNTPTSCDPKIDNIKRRIMKAIRNGTEYAGRKWSYK